MPVKSALAIFVAISALLLLWYVYAEGREDYKKEVLDANREANDAASDRRTRLSDCDGMFDFWTGGCERAP